MKIDTATFRVRAGAHVELKVRPTRAKPCTKSKEQTQEIFSEHIKELSALQNLLYASNRYSVLLIFQAMDAIGKDSAIKHVMSGVNPQGCQVFSFNPPSAEKLEIHENSQAYLFIHSGRIRLELQQWLQVLARRR